MKSSKNLGIKPEFTSTAKKIYQAAINVENLDEKHGKGLPEEENNIRRFILSQSPILGRIPFIKEIKERFVKMTNEKIQVILKKLDELDVIHLDNNKTIIAAAYPFSGYKTAHLIKFKREKYNNIYSMCAVDALGIGFMLDCDISIDSKCFHCNEEINITIENNEIVYLKPETIVVWFDMEYSCCAATSLCKNINFFSSTTHFTDWQQDKSKRNGALLQIQGAFYLGKLFFEKRLKY